MANLALEAAPKLKWLKPNERKTELTTLTKKSLAGLATLGFASLVLAGCAGGAATEEAAEKGAYWNTAFHTIIVESADNAYLSRIYEGVYATIEQGMFLMRMLA